MNNKNRCYTFSQGGYVEKRGNVEPAICNKFNFVKHKSGTGFSVHRPAFRGGIAVVKNQNVGYYKNDRSGTGNYNMERNNFLAPPIRGREAIDFEKLQLQDIQDAGVKVQLGDKTLEKLFGIQVEDKTDRAWIAEKERRIRAGETEAQIKANPPFGRPQRKVRKMVNFAQQGAEIENKINMSGLQIEDQIELLKAAVQANNVETKNELQTISGGIAVILGEVDNLQQLTDAQVLETKRIVDRLNIPKNYRAAGLSHRLWSKEEWNKDFGIVNMYILSRAQKRWVNLPIINKSTKKRNKLLSAFNNLKNGFLDLEYGFVISMNEAMDLANTGIDSGVLNGIPAPQGGWTDANNPFSQQFQQLKPVSIPDPDEGEEVEGPAFS